MVTPDEIYTTWEKTDYFIEAAKNQLAWTMEKEALGLEQMERLMLVDEYLTEAQKELGQINVS